MKKRCCGERAKAMKAGAKLASAKLSR